MKVNIYDNNIQKSENFNFLQNKQTNKLRGSLVVNQK